jgi:hypothetical protein
MLVLYKGSRGRGKTLSMVKDAYQYYLNGYRVLSNIHLKFGEYIENEQILNLNKDSDLYNCVLLIDELQIIFDSRNFTNKQNKSFSYFIFQIRKRNIIILGTTQYTDSVEKRYRQNLDIVVSPLFVSELNICVVSYFDITSLENLDINPSDLEPSVVVFDAVPIFSLYDTYEMLS